MYLAFEPEILLVEIDLNETLAKIWKYVHTILFNTALFITAKDRKTTSNIH